MSIEILPTAKEPKRERGKQRVAALIDAGAELFAEKGYEATTMTEIASRRARRSAPLSVLSVQGSAGRGAVQPLRRAGGGVLCAGRGAGPRTVGARARGPAHRLQARAQGPIATRRLRSRASVAGIVERRKPLGDALRGRIAAILRAANPALGEDEAAAAAIIVNQVMKMVPALAATEDERAGGADRRNAEAPGALHRRGLAERRGPLRAAQSAYLLITASAMARLVMTPTTSAARGRCAP